MSETNPKIYLVAAVASNGVIGRDGHLPWHLPEDLQHFKRLTLGHPIIMGRRTWESLPRALPGRDNIVVSASPGYDAPGAAVANSLEGAIALCAGESVAFVIGGSRLFADSLPIAAGLVMTEIERDYEGDTWFPQYDHSRWRESQREHHVAEDGTKFAFVLYERAS
ncbi:MAG TPA: dihydrofolate reductase [Burkholderiales bacterium]|nr:dihydrofolate reductase [Burkholderiales bacterium]